MGIANLTVPFPASAVPLPASSPPASALSVAGAESEPPAYPLQEEWAAVSAPSAEAFAAAEQVGSGLAWAGWVQDERFRDG
jgi:hypothetical protein